MVWLNMVSDIINKSIDFVDQVYIPDLKAIASFYKDWGYGGGLAGKNMLAYGDFPINANDWSNDNLMMPAGAIINGDLSQVYEVDVRDPEQIQEFVNHSWYKYSDESAACIPGTARPSRTSSWDPNLKGTRTNIEQIDEGGKYSWLKAPRWKGHAMEVGPLSRYVIGYASGREDIKEQVDGILTDLGLPITALFSTLGRTAARGLECSWAAHKMRTVFDAMMANIKAGDTPRPTWTCGSRRPGRLTSRVWAWSKRRAAHSATGATSRTPSWPTIRPSCPRPGTRHRGIRPGTSAPTRRRCSVRRWPTRSSRWRSCAPSTALIRVWPVPAM